MVHLDVLDKETENGHGNISPVPQVLGILTYVSILTKVYRLRLLRILFIITNVLLLSLLNIVLFNTEEVLDHQKNGVD